jgi:HK97 gp10 family phage protein
MRNVTVLFNHLPRIIRQMPGRIDDTVRDAALDCETYAKDVVPVDTGALKNSIRAEPESDKVWIVAPHTEYAIYVEFGTRKMRAQPYMRPAAEKVRKHYPDLLVDTIIKTAKGQEEWFTEHAPEVTTETFEE